MAKEIEIEITKWYKTTAKRIKITKWRSFKLMAKLQTNSLRNEKLMQTASLTNRNWRSRFFNNNNDNNNICQQFMPQKYTDKIW